MEKKPLLEGEGQPSAPPGPSAPLGPSAPPGPPTASVASAPPGPAQGPPQYPPDPQPLPQSQPPPYHPGQLQGGYGAVPTVVAQQPRAQPVNPNYNQRPSNYLVLNIITMFFCCFLFGLIGLLSAMQVDKAWDAGDRQKAHQHSLTAKKWGIAALVSGCVVQLVSVGIIIISAAVIAAVGASASSG